LRVEIYNKVKEDVEKWFEHVIDELRRNSVDEKAVKSIVKATTANEIARLHSIVMEEFDRLKAKVEELSKQSANPEFTKELVDEIYNKLLNDVRQLLDQRIMHLLDTINEQSSNIKDVLDLVNELLKAETEFEEKLAKLRDEIRGMFSEERLEEVVYKTMIKRGIIRRKRRRWALPVVGFGILAAIIAGFVINPIVTFVIMAIAIGILLRW
jgi:flagellar motility protein MotE (MotC chaperone)